ncbi:MAG TPA: YezD family protein [Verrucomicrobiae bacterium]
MATSHFNADRSEDDLKWLEIVRQQVSFLKFGVMQIVVHDSRITQIEKTERVRFDKQPQKIH